MHGNVQEWTNDGYAGFSADEATDPTRPADARRYTWHVACGGSFNFGAANCRSAFRYNIGPRFRLFDTGLRVVCNKD
jgi:formylglycine-generating enzyme required for sulfatase activity